jgi:phosphopantothenoylcysteine synthetase/decarboxylase
MEKRRTALVVAGGTEEPIDDVRAITNHSSGRFGAAIANELVNAGFQVTILASRRLRAHPSWMNPKVSVLPFSSFQSLSELLEQTLAKTSPDLLFMAAAVADYSPIPVDGKMSSDQDELVIRMKRNPKLLASLREKCGPGSLIIGFKLLSNVSTETLIQVASEQASAYQLDLTVANDASEFTADYHPIWMVSPTGEHRFAGGTKAAIAAALVSHTLEVEQRAP